MVSSKRRPLIITAIILVVVFVVTRITSAKSHEALAMDRILPLYNKHQDEFLKNMEKLQSKYMKSSDERLASLERTQELILEQLKAMKVPPLNLPLREKLVHMMPYDPKQKIPGYIWQTWKHGLNDDRFDRQYREGQAQWAYKNPGFVHELFNDDTSYAILRNLYSLVPEVVEAYESLPEVILKMDFFRYLILFAKGGVYADVDTYPLQPVPNWIPENVSPTELGLILAVGSDASSPNWRQSNHRRLEFGQFVIQSKPGHPVLREMIAQITENTLRMKHNLKDGASLSLDGSANQRQLQISKWTGTGLWTDVVMNYLNDYVKSLIYQSVTWKEFHKLETPKLVSDILVLPISSFASEVDIPKDGKVSDPLAYVKHSSAKIWRTT